MMTSACAAIPYVCPRCRGALAEEPEAYRCAACARSYPIVFGIPDFRLRPDPYIGIEEDRAKGLRIAREAAGRDLRGLLEFYWSITPQVEAARAKGFVESVLAARGRGEEILDWVARRSGFQPDVGLKSRPTNAGEGFPILEIGCGAGGLLAAAVSRGAQVVGVDRGFRWLVVAKMALEREGLQAQLVCADARELPFADATFGLALADGVIEHNDTAQDRIPAEAARVLRGGGIFFASTPNRFAPLPDPHYRVPLLGWLPRAAMPWAVRAWRGKEYLHIRLLSPGELARFFRRAGFARVEISPAAFGERTRARFTGLKRAALNVYTALSGFAPTRWMLARLGPVVWCLGRKAV